YYIFCFLVCIIFYLFFYFFYFFLFFFFFFFQAEDGIRDRTVTGVQTCALPIFLDLRSADLPEPRLEGRVVQGLSQPSRDVVPDRSEERRVGKECRSRWWPDP